MSDLYKIILTACVTIFGGVLVFVTGQIILKFIIEPIQEHKKTIGKIAYAMIYYANVYTYRFEPKELLENDFLRNKVDSCHEELRVLSSDVIAKSYLIPRYNFFTKIRIVPPMENINETATSLRYLSNAVKMPQIYDMNEIKKNRNKVKEKLKIII